MSITYKLTATETCEERDKIIRTREFKTCTGLNPKPGPGPGPAQDQELRPVSGPGPPEKAKARPVQASDSELRQEQTSWSVSGNKITEHDNLFYLIFYSHLYIKNLLLYWYESFYAINTNL